jgi:hypothetical protein
MFVVNEAEAAAIRAAYERGGEVLAGAELCRLFPGLADKVRARLSARMIAGWQPVTERTDHEEEAKP